MNRKVIKNIFFYGIGDFIVTGVTAFLFIPLYIKYLSVSEYGIFNVLNNNSTIFTYIFQFGIVSAFARIYFIRKAEKKEKAYTWNIIFLHIFYSLFLFLIIYLFRDFIFTNLSPSIKDSRLFNYPVAIAFLTFLPSLYYIYLRVEEKASLFVIYQIANVALIILCIFLNWYFYKLDLYTILLSFFVTNATIWLVVILKFLPSFSIELDRKDFIDTIRFSFPIFISYIAYFFIAKYSIVILQNHISLKDIGLFSLAQQISSIPSLVTIAITKAVQPYLFSSNSTAELKDKTGKFDSSYKLIMIWVVGCLIFSVDIVFSSFLPSSYYSIHNVTKWLLLISLIYNFSIVENSILLYFMKSKVILAITLVGSILNVLLSNILVYKFSINGILIAMAIAFSVNFLLDVFFSRKHVRLDYNIKALLPCLMIIILFIIITSSNLVPLLIHYKVAYTIISFLVLTVSVALFLKKTNHDFIK
ncbi:oligosaccharide flippase family protein [Pedobacter sp. ASV1-7]|uniref:lipopolysaccharide biosynthesis protein n=1 Tax=Pedobacter sp. ASV1-7 TaxID=3145237 RepID=UPI0032E8DFDC